MHRKLTIIVTDEAYRGLHLDLPRPRLLVAAPEPLGRRDGRLDSAEHGAERESASRREDKRAISGLSTMPAARRVPNCDATRVVWGNQVIEGSLRESGAAEYFRGVSTRS